MLAHAHTPHTAFDMSTTTTMMMITKAKWNKMREKRRHSEMARKREREMEPGEANLCPWKILTTMYEWISLFSHYTQYFLRRRRRRHFFHTFYLLWLVFSYHAKHAAYSHPLYFIHTEMNVSLISVFCWLVACVCLCVVWIQKKIGIPWRLAHILLSSHKTYRTQNVYHTQSMARIKWRKSHKSLQSTCAVLLECV